MRDRSAMDERDRYIVTKKKSTAGNPPSTSSLGSNESSKKGLLRSEVSLAADDEHEELHKHNQRTKRVAVWAERLERHEATSAHEQNQTVAQRNGYRAEVAHALAVHTSTKGTSILSAVLESLGKCFLVRRLRGI